MTPCEHCGRDRTVTVGMDPGSDSKPWTLCVRCWLDGVRPMKEPVAAPSEPEPASAPKAVEPKKARSRKER